MCWNAEVSLQSFAIGFTIVLLAYSQGMSFSTALFCMTIVFMQLIEYIVWKNIDNAEINYQASRWANFLLWLQPVASILTLSVFWQIPLLLGYMFLTLLGKAFETSSLREKYRMFPGENKHLVWNWLQKDMYTSISLFVYFLFLLLPLLLSGQWTILLLALSTLGLSLYSFWKDNTWGSMWCWIVNYLVVGVSFQQILVAKP